MLVYKQQLLSGDRRVGFRNSNHESWIMYDTPPFSAVLNYAPNGQGYTPQESWVKCPQAI